MELLRELLILIHIILVIVWLGVDFVVFSLSFSLLKRELPIEVRLDRARLADKFDGWVVSASMAIIPTGIALAWLGGHKLFIAPWLAFKLFFFGIILLIMIWIFATAGTEGTVALLKSIQSGEGNLEDLETKLRKRVIFYAPPVLAIHACIIAMIYIAMNPGKW